MNDQTNQSDLELKSNIVEVSAKSIFMDEYSSAAKSKFLFCYKIKITNLSDNIVQLLNRHWIIIDSDSHKSEVKGPGVVGQQPVLEPGAYHEYFSFCNLDTGFGSMEGFFEFENEDGSKFLSAIPRFFLSSNLNEFDKNTFMRGQIVRHKSEEFRAIIADYDMYFMNDEELYKKDPNNPAKDKPWYYLLIDGSNAISYVPQESLELDGEQDLEVEHPLFNFFFEGFDGQKFVRNDKTWENLKTA